MGKLTLLKRKILGKNLLHSMQSLSGLCSCFQPQMAVYNSLHLSPFLAVEQALLLTVCTLSIWHDPGLPQGGARLVLNLQ